MVSKEWHGFNKFVELIIKFRLIILYGPYQFVGSKIFNQLTFLEKIKSIDFTKLMIEAESRWSMGRQLKCTCKFNTDNLNTLASFKDLHALADDVTVRPY